jgi:hypothetical protein
MDLIYLGGILLVWAGAAGLAWGCARLAPGARP